MVYQLPLFPLDDYETTVEPDVPPSVDSEPRPLSSVEGYIQLPLPFPEDSFEVATSTDLAS